MSYWRWWWQTQAGRRTKTLLVLAGAAVGGLAGYALAAGAFTSAEAAGRVEVTTLRRVEVRSQPVIVDKLVTIRLDGRTVRKLVPVVRTVTGRSSTLFVTETSSPAVRISTVTAPTTFRPPEQPAAAVAGSGTTVVETRVV